jgi:hypothetical protein
MRKQIILTAFIASLAGVRAAYAQEPRDFSLPATQTVQLPGCDELARAVQNRWLAMFGTQAQQRNSSGTDDLVSLRRVSSRSWLDGVTEALARWWTRIRGSIEATTSVPGSLADIRKREWHVR